MKKIKARRELRRRLGREYTRSDGRKMNKNGQRRDLNRRNAASKMSRGPVKRKINHAIVDEGKNMFETKEELAVSTESNEARRQMFGEQIEDDDKELHYLEKQLRFNKRKNKAKIPQSLIEMGLDDIIEACDVIEKSGKRKLNSSADGAAALLTKKKKKKLNEVEMSDAEKSESESVSNDESDLVDAESESETEEESAADVPIEEDTDEEDEEKIASLQSKLSMPLQQVSVDSLERVVNLVRSLLTEAPRALLVKALTRQILACCSAATAPLFVLNLGALLTALHVQGIDLGAPVTAPILEAIVLRYQALWNECNQQDEQEAKHLLLLVAHLFQFGMCEHRLLMDLLMEAANRLKTFDINMIIEVLKAVGFPLRKANPTDMKHFMTSIQQTLQSADYNQKEEEDRSRVEFLTDVILQAIVNNNYRKLPGYEPFHADCLKRLLPALRVTAAKQAASQRRHTAAPALACTLQDLLQAHNRGRWWLVGSSYTDKETSTAAAVTTPVAKTREDHFVSPKVDALAQRLGVAGSEHRIRILVAILSVQSPQDAFEALQRLSLSHVHERDLMPLLLLCLLRGRQYNAFYSELMSIYCQHHRRFKMSLRCALWDQFTALETAEEKPRQGNNRCLRHLARALSAWLVEGTLCWTLLRRFPLEAAALGASASSVASIAPRRFFVLLLSWLLQESCHDFAELESTCDPQLRRRLRRALKSCTRTALTAVCNHQVKSLGDDDSSNRDFSPRESLRRLFHALRSKQFAQTDSSAQLLSRALQ